MMDWEEYLTVAVSRVADKYQARRYKAHFRAQILERYFHEIESGQEPADAMALAMDSLGDPTHLAERVSQPIRHQRGWLWLLSLAQLTAGVFIVAFSLKTESFGALALGRILTLWGAVATGFQARRFKGIHWRFRLWQLRLKTARRSVLMRDLERMTVVGFASGLMVALVASLPWNVVTANMFHPVVLSMGSSLALSGLVVAAPWVWLRRWLGQGFYLVTFQACASLSAAIGATALILWHQGFAPPPMFNWQPEMLAAGGWVFNFMVLRLVTAIVTFRERVVVGLDEERFPLV